MTRLADLGARVTLMTFDKTADRANAGLVAATAAELNRHGVRWLPQSYHKRPKAAAKGLDFLLAWATGAAAGRFDLVHARTYTGGLMGLPLARLLRTKLVYHNEGFYPDEQVDGGVWRLGSARHRLARSLEGRLYATADGIIALSHRARSVIDALPPVRRRRTPTTVVPSCVNLDLFRPLARPQALANELRLVYIGTMGLRYLFHRVARFVAVAREELGTVRLRVLTRTDPAEVTATLRAAGLPDHAWSLGSVPHLQMPCELAHQHAGLFFLTQGISEHGCSPTKVGEYWASGLPVVSTPNVSDTDNIARRYRVGVVVNEHTDNEYRRAARELLGLLDDPELSVRCRRAAEDHYDLDAACRRQMALYKTVLTRKSGRT
ncbi:MAG TPA: glycosyltransferase [Gemmataceae bacterium]|nr:glycosyltransferase [Gemmataceae bacterium]